MKLLTAVASLLLVSAASCSSTPEMATVSGALVAQAPESSRAAVDVARHKRDDAEDTLSAAEATTMNFDEKVQIARAELRSTRSQVDKAKFTVQLTEKSGTPEQLKSAKAAHALSLATADVARNEVAVSKRQLELARLRQKLALEQHRMSIAEVEYSKALAVQDVNLVAAKQVPVRDFKRQVRYHDREVEVALERVEDAEKRLAEDEVTLEEAVAEQARLLPVSE